MTKLVLLSALALSSVGMCGGASTSATAEKVSMESEAVGPGGVILAFRLRNISSVPLEFDSRDLPWSGGANLEVQVVEITNKMTVIEPIGVISDPARRPLQRLEPGASVSGEVDLSLAYPSIPRRQRVGYLFACWRYDASRAFGGSAATFSDCTLLSDPLPDADTNLTRRALTD